MRCTFEHFFLYKATLSHDSRTGPESIDGVYKLQTQTIAAHTGH
jgi:hypothetical protein